MCSISSWLSTALKSMVIADTHKFTVVLWLQVFWSVVLYGIEVPNANPLCFKFLVWANRWLQVSYHVLWFVSCTLKDSKTLNVCKSGKPDECTPPYVVWQNDWIACFFILKLCRFITSTTLMMNKSYPRKERDLMVTEGKWNWIYAPYKAVCRRHICNILSVWAKPCVMFP